MKDLEPIAFNEDCNGFEPTSTTIDVNVGEYLNVGHFLLPPLHENVEVSEPQMLVSNGPTSSEVSRAQLVVVPSTCQDSNNLQDSHFLHQINFPASQSTVSNSHDFSHQMITESFSEHISVSALPAEPRHSCAAFCNYESEQHCRDTVHLATTMAPVGYNSSIICFINCSKKRFRTTVNFEPRLRPVHYEETQFVRPKRMESRFVSYLDYKTETSRRWYTSSVQINHKAGCSSFVHDFQFNEIYSEAGEDDIGSIGSSGFSDDEGILNMECNDMHNGHSHLEAELFRTGIVVGK
jgi:hypothetical protein